MAKTSRALGSTGDFESIIQGDVDAESTWERLNSQYSQIGELQNEEFRGVSVVEVLTDIRELALGVLLEVWDELS